MNIYSRAAAEATKQIAEMDLQGLTDYAVNCLSKFFIENPESLTQAESDRTDQEEE